MKLESGVMAWQLQALAALSKNLDLIHSVHMAADNYMEL